MRLISFGISALLWALVGCAAGDGTGNASAADTTTGGNGSDNPNDPPMLSVMTIPEAVAALESPEIVPAGGMNDAYPASGATPLDAIKEYIDGKYDKDPEDGTDFTFVDGAAGFDVDTEVAGTMATDVAIEQTLGAIASDDTTHDVGAIDARSDEIRGILQSIAAAGGSFGFDGFGENGCAAPTSFLLIVDEAGQTVYGVDLNPCTK